MCSARGVLMDLNHSIWGPRQVMPSSLGLARSAKAVSRMGRWRTVRLNGQHIQVTALTRQRVERSPGVIDEEANKFQSDRSFHSDRTIDLPDTLRSSPARPDESDGHRLTSGSARKVSARRATGWCGVSALSEGRSADDRADNVSGPIARPYLAALLRTRTEDLGRLEVRRSVAPSLTSSTHTESVALFVEALVADGKFLAAIRRRYASFCHDVLQASTVPLLRLLPQRPTDLASAWLARINPQLHSFATAQAIQEHRESKIRDTRQARIYCPWPPPSLELHHTRCANRMRDANSDETMTPRLFHSRGSSATNNTFAMWSKQFFARTPSCPAVRRSRTSQSETSMRSVGER